jgi:hypothetical protein
MVTINLNPTLFHLGPLALSWYRLAVAADRLVGIWLLLREAQRSIKARPTTSVPLAARKPSRRNPRNTSRTQRAAATSHTTRPDADADTCARHSWLPEAGAARLLPLLVSPATKMQQTFSGRAIPNLW